ncbi:hypothetical protein ACWGOQ_0000785 [Aquimarina sp. M1]
MKNYTLLLLFVFICCKSESKSSDDLENTTKITTTETVSDTSVETNDGILTQKTYTATQKDANGSFTQKLSVSWLTEDTIQYTLVFENQSCQKRTISGKATALKPKEEPFMISYKGASIKVKKYVYSKQGYEIELQIDAVNKDKAIVELDLNENSENENCTPSDVVMIAQN